MAIEKVHFFIWLVTNKGDKISVYGGVSCYIKKQPVEYGYWFSFYWGKNLQSSTMTVFILNKYEEIYITSWLALFFYITYITQFGTYDISIGL